LRNKEDKLVIGSWNDKTLLKPEKIQELLGELHETQMKIVDLQEIRWAGNGLISKKDFQLLFSGTQKFGQAGSGFYVKKEIAKHIIGFKAVSKRICKLRIKRIYTNATLISVYPPPEDNKIKIKVHSYDELQRVLEGTRKSDAAKILGDLIAKLGREEIYCNISGKCT
jgi:exonuclease III